MDKSELQEWENKCIQEEPPQCMAGCPIHVDARLFVKQVGLGEWDDAFKTLSKTMPFPRILGRICDHPCEPLCKRGEVGEPIAIGALERTCVENTREKVKGVDALPEKTAGRRYRQRAEQPDGRLGPAPQGISGNHFRTGRTTGWHSLGVSGSHSAARMLLPKRLSLLESLGADIALSADLAEDDFIAGLQRENSTPCLSVLIQRA